MGDLAPASLFFPVPPRGNPRLGEMLSLLGCCVVVVVVAAAIVTPPSFCLQTVLLFVFQVEACRLADAPLVVVMTYETWSMAQ